jgi:FixJ family two-component response regulator
VYSRASCGRGISTATRIGGILQDQVLVSVVDDDQAFRDSMRRLLRSLGYRVAVFPSASEFLGSSQFALTTCLVADIQMPDMTGIELFLHLVALERVVPTVLITAYPDDNDRKRMLSLGVECYLRKPLVENELIGCLRSAIMRRGVNPGAV